MEIKVRGCAQWTSCTYMEWNDETSCNCFKWGGRGCGEMVGAIEPLYVVSLFKIVTMNPPCTTDMS
jgi:hypothetical protein